MKSDGGEGGHFLVAVDKVCELAAAVGVGCLISAYAHVGTVVPWVVLGVALAVKVVIHIF